MRSRVPCWLQAVQGATRAWGRGRLLTAFACSLWLGCLSTGTRFDSAIQTGFMRAPMRHLETEHVELYYPAPYSQAAARIVGRLERCTSVLSGKARLNPTTGKMLVYLTQTNFNNAYVQSDAGGAPLQMVLPLHSTLETDHFNLLGTVTQGNVACHEAAHYVQDQVTTGFWWYLNVLGGPLLEPSQGLERWFTEGLAVWAEGHVDLKTGRPHSPFWNGMFEAAMTTRGEGRPRWGDLDIGMRDLYQSGAYLTSSHFIDYLIRRFGEEKIWELVEREGSAVVPNVGIGLLFKAVYGETLTGLLDAWGAELAKAPMRARPADQRVLSPDAGTFARIAVSPADGAIAEISRGYDYPLRLAIRDASGRLRLNLPLTKFLPGREWVYLGADGISGLRFSSNGRLLFFVGSSLTADGEDGSRLYALDATSGDVVGRWELTGLGGDIAPDTQSYVYVDVDGDQENLVRLDLESGKREKLTNIEPGRSIGAPAIAADGKRIAFALWTGESFDLALRDADGKVDLLTQDGHAGYAPRWIDDGRLLFLREREGRWQVHVYDLSTRTFAPVTNVPHLALDPMPWGGEVVFLNREGVQFTIDVAPLPILPEASAPATAPLAPPPLSAEAAPLASIAGDRPAGAGEGLLVPILHVPFIQVEPTPRWPWGFTGGLLLNGSDRLGIHNYAASVSYDTRTRDVSFSVDYIFHGLAPSQLALHVGRSVGVGSENRTLAAAWRRSFWDVPVSLNLLANDQLLRQQDGTTLRTTLVGPRAGISYASSETTPYGGVRRSLRIGLSGAIYADLAERNAPTIGDVRPTLGATLPLPILKRHALSIDLTGRALLGPKSILAVGGFSSGQQLLLQPSPPDSPTSDGPVVYSPGEFVRGYEDYSILTNAALIGTARYRYPFIIDRGWTTFLWVLPSVFVSQVNVDVFGTEVIYANPKGTNGQSYLRAVGTAVTLNTLWGQAAGVSLTYQFSWRFDQGLKPMHLIWIGF